MTSLLPALATMLRLTARFSPSLATYLFNSFCTALSERLGFTSSALFERATGLMIPSDNKEALQSAFALWAHRVLGDEPQEAQKTIDEIFGQGGKRAQAALLSALRKLPKHEICSLSTCAKEAMGQALIGNNDVIGNNDGIDDKARNRVLIADVLRCLLENPRLRSGQDVNSALTTIACALHCTFQ
jgi:hypothetical protein